ncbi:MAG: methionyl-tRNA formyltransferase [Clostridia bacterium]|nr:methionyl-tRNA formyltransferase [Clostridia bacterium]
MNKRLVFMGTGPFALTALEALYGALQEGDCLSVYTKEPKRAGRGMNRTQGCVALFALEKGLPLYQPHSLRDEEAKEVFLSLGAQLVVVASYGLILPPYVLHTPEYGCVNIHASLLPKYRGAAPINRAIMDGEEKTGVTIMQMDEGLDTGDMLAKRETSIEAGECAGELFERLAKMGSEMLLEILPSIYEKKLSPEKQDESLSTYAAKIAREDQEIDFSLPSQRVLDRIRGLCPVPSALCRTEDGKLLKIHSARSAEGDFDADPGRIVAVKPRVLVKTGDGVIELDQVQPEGKGRMKATDAANGRKLNLGERLL